MVVAQYLGWVPLVHSFRLDACQVHRGPANICFRHMHLRLTFVGTPPPKNDFVNLSSWHTLQAGAVPRECASHGVLLLYC